MSTILLCKCDYCGHKEECAPAKGYEKAIPTGWLMTASGELNSTKDLCSKCLNKLKTETTPINNKNWGY